MKKKKSPAFLVDETLVVRLVMLFLIFSMISGAGALCPASSSCGVLRRRLVAPQCGGVTCTLFPTLLQLTQPDATCDWSCNQPNWGDDLQSCGDNENCVCDVTTEGVAFCLQNQACHNRQPCTTSDNCSNPQQRCIPDTCCGIPVCANPCTQDATDTTSQLQDGATSSTDTIAGKPLLLLPHSV